MHRTYVTCPSHDACVMIVRSDGEKEHIPAPKPGRPRQPRPSRAPEPTPVTRRPQFRSTLAGAAGGALVVAVVEALRALL